MELRKCEDTMDELTMIYESIRTSSVLEQEHVVLPEYQPTTAAAAAAVEGDETVQKEQVPPPQVKLQVQVQVQAISELSVLAERLLQLQTCLQELQPKLVRFRKKLAETDPVTGNPRYGAKTQTRVQILVDTYDFLIPLVIAESTEGGEGGGDQTSNSTSSSNILMKFQQRHEQQEAQTRQAQFELEERTRQELEEQARQEQESARAAESQRLQLEQRLQQEQAEAQAVLHQQAQVARQRRLAQEQAEQEWVNSIFTKTPDGIQAQLSRLKESTRNDLAAQQVALTSLYQIFSQINAHPEETKFRRIRRDHAQFVQDVGRHAGGVEVLIAAGFTLGAIDDVPSYISKEPDLENDMDGWSAWFDLLKATLEILEQEQQSKKR